MAYEAPLQSMSFPSTASALIQYRLVVMTSGGGIKHSTGLSTGAAAVRPLGVVQEPVSAAGRAASVMLYGITKIAASTKAIKAGAYLRQTSGAASTGTNLGGTVMAATNQSAYYTIGQALTSCAAAAAGNIRYVSVVLKL
jgi:hypothetical protein